MSVSLIPIVECQEVLVALAPLDCVLSFHQNTPYPPGRLPFQSSSRVRHASKGSITIILTTPSRRGDEHYIHRPASPTIQGAMLIMLICPRKKARKSQKASMSIPVLTGPLPTIARRRRQHVGAPIPPTSETENYSPLPHRFHDSISSQSPGSPRGLARVGALEYGVLRLPGGRRASINASSPKQAGATQPSAWEP